jgi:hypothetical protein
LMCEKQNKHIEYMCLYVHYKINNFLR